MVPREKILIGMPVFDFRLDSGLVLGLLACTKYFGTMPVFYGGSAYIQLGRNAIAHHFVEERKECDWLMWIDSDIRFTEDDWKLLWEGDELVVCAEYSKKLLGAPPAKLGLGFCRVHRSVFEKLRDLKDADGQDLIRRYFHDGKLVVDYHTQHVSSQGQFRGEDHGFFQWCMAHDVSTRIETRTRLGHVGTYCFAYPDQIPGLQLIEPPQAGAN